MAADKKPMTLFNWNRIPKWTIGRRSFVSMTSDGIHGRRR
jgi:hypothetical protein